jgi:hypothetical protein
MADSPSSASMLAGAGSRKIVARSRKASAA